MSDLANSRHLALEGIDNIRDLGGLRTHDGRRTRSGRLLRSSAVHAVTEADVQQLAESYGVKLVIDLRTPGEIDRTGRGLLSRHIPAYVNLPILGSHMKHADTLVDASLPSMTEHYLNYLAFSPAQITIAMRLLASHAHLPALFHCAAGKDRTGVLAAVLLDALGVQHDDIVADYALTAERMPPLIARLRNDAHSRALLDSVPAYALEAHPATMRAVLAHLHDSFGGARPWLLQHGLEPDAIGRLQDALLD